MRTLDLILKKRNGQQLMEEEIDFLVQGYTSGSIPDYQIAAFLMAVFFKGLTFEETRALTQSFIKSGDVLDLKDIPGIKVDKHSTGGVGDKTTLVLVPLLAAAGLTVVKMSGRALGHTGGTLDKLESIPGFRINLEIDEIKRIACRTGAAIAGQSARLVPADKKFYSLRDVTGTVDCLPLIASSVMSKKIAGGADNIILDVKVGVGGFLSGLEDARKLAVYMVDLGRAFGRKTVAVLSSMEQPLGYEVGNALEVREAILTLQGKGPADLTELCCVLGGQILFTSGKVFSSEAGKRKIEQLLLQGAGLTKMKEIIAAQGGNPAVIENLDLLPQAPYKIEVRSEEKGYVKELNAREIGWVAHLLGAGRLKKDDPINPAVGVTLKKKAGDFVSPGEALAVIHAAGNNNLMEIEERVRKAFVICKNPPQTVNPLVYEII